MLTRATRRLSIIGSRKSWKGYPIFSILVQLPDLIADTVYEAAIDGKYRVRFAGEDTKAIYAIRLEPGSKVFRKEIRKKIVG